MKTPTLLLLAAALCATADEPAIAITGAEPGVWTQDYAAATNAAAASGKPVLLDFTGSDWCGWCMLMENKVFCTQEWEDWAASNIYLVALDFPQDESKVPEDYQKRNRELSNQYGVRGYPTYIVLDSKGQKLGQLGADRKAKPAKFIRQLCGVLGIDPPAKADAASADPAAKRILVGIAAAIKANNEAGKGIDNPTAAQYVALNERLSAALGTIETDGAPEPLLAAFRTFRDAFETFGAECKKLDQSLPLEKLGDSESEAVEKAAMACQKALDKFVEAAEAAGVEDAADLLDF